MLGFFCTPTRLSAVASAQAEARRGARPPAVREPSRWESCEIDGQTGEGSGWGRRARLGCWFSRPAETNFRSSAAVPTDTEQIAFVTLALAESGPGDTAAHNALVWDRLENLPSNGDVLSR